MAATLSGKFLSELDNLSATTDILATDYLLMSHTTPGGHLPGAPAHLISYSVSVDTMARRFGEIVNKTGDHQASNHILSNYGFAVDVANNAANINANKLNIQWLSGYAEDNREMINDHTTRLNGHDAYLDTLSGKTVDNHTDILSNRTTIDINTSKIAYLSGVADNHTGRLNGHDSDIASIRSRVTTNETNIANNTADIAEHQLNIDYLSSRVTTDTANIAEHQRNIDYLSGQVDTCSRIGHTHAIANVNGLQAALDGKSNVGHRHQVADIDGLGTSLGSFAPLNHTHAIADVNNLQSALDGKSNVGHNHDERYSQLGHNHDSLYSRLGHKHVCADITDFPTIDSGSKLKYTAGQINYAAKSGKVISGYVTFFTASSDCIVTCTVTLGKASGCGNTTSRNFEIYYDGSWHQLVPSAYSSAMTYENVTLILKAGDKLRISGYCSSHPSYYQYSASYLTRT